MILRAKQDYSASMFADHVVQGADNIESTFLSVLFSNFGLNMAIKYRPTIRPKTVETLELSERYSYSLPLFNVGKMRKNP